MNPQRLLLILAATVLASTTLFAQFTPRKDYVWARDVSVAASPTITIDGVLNEAVWAKAESVLISYGTADGNPGSGWKVMNGTGTPTDGAKAVLKFLTNKTTNKLYVAVIAKDSSIGGGGWENSDGILGGFYDRSRKAKTDPPNRGSWVTLQRDIFISWIDSTRVGALPNLKGGDLPTNNIVVASASVQGVANSDTNASGQKVADQGWIIEMAVSLDSLGYSANSATTEEIQMSMSIWDADWIQLPGHIATKAWWLNEWGNSGGGTAGRILVRNDVNVNTTSLPAYAQDVTIRNGANFPNVVVDGDLKDSVWAYVPYFDIQWSAGATTRQAYPTVGKDRSGQWITKLSGVLASPIDAGRARIKMFFKNDTLYIGADVNDQSLLSNKGDDFFDGLQISLDVPIDSLRDVGAHVMAGKRYGFSVDSVSKGGSSLLWDAGDLKTANALKWGLKLKTGSTIDNVADVDVGYTIEAAFNLNKLGYTAGQVNRVIAIGVDYHDYDRSPTDTTAYRAWWFREWPWSASPAFCILDNSALISVTGVSDQGPTVANEFRLYGNYPNPFNPSTKIQFSLPGAGIARILVFDLLGRLVSSSEAVVPSAGMQEWTFNASNLATGVYYYRVEFVPRTERGKQLSETKKMLLVK